LTLKANCGSIRVFDLEDKAILNSVIMIGRMVCDAELKYTSTGTAVANFRIAVDRNRKDENGEKETDFFDVTAWKQSAEFAANYLGKGRLIAVDGRLQCREWVDKEGGKRKSYEIVANDLRGLDKPKTEEA
jgi:single-strand DNA-binding protein